MERKSGKRNEYAPESIVIIIIRITIRITIIIRRTSTPYSSNGQHVAPSRRVYAASSRNRLTRARSHYLEDGHRLLLRFTMTTIIIVIILYRDGIYARTLSDITIIIVIIVIDDDRDVTYCTGIVNGKPPDVCM